MFTIRRDDCYITIFPDGQPHVQLTTTVGPGTPVELIWSIQNANDFLMLLELSEALDFLRVRKARLLIPYLFGARYDRHMVVGDSCDLKVIANAINSCRFESVGLFDVHSDVALTLINGAYNIPNDRLLGAYECSNAVLIVPDAGALKRVDQIMKWEGVFSEYIVCTKYREPRTGKIWLKALEVDRCADRHCVVVDDICDGGATFTALADEITREVKPKTLTLIVSHGIFSRGFDELLDRYDSIIVSNSYAATWLKNREYPESRVTVIPVFSEEQ